MLAPRLSIFSNSMPGCSTGFQMSLLHMAQLMTLIVSGCVSLIVLARDYGVISSHVLAKTILVLECEALLSPFPNAGRPACQGKGVRLKDQFILV